MRIYNFKRFWQGIGFAVLTTVLIVLMILDWGKNDNAPFKSLVLIVFGFVIAIGSFGVAFSPDSKKKDAIEAKDERNQLISQRSAAQSFIALLGLLIVVSVGTGILYVFVRTPVVLGIFAVTTAITNLAFYIWIGTTVYYNRKL